MKRLTCKLLLATAVLPAFFSCTREESGLVSEDITAPIVRLGDDVIPNALMVKFAAPLDEERRLVLEEQQGMTLERVFPSTPGREALERQFGLDRWYVAEFSEAENLDAKAMEISRIPSVKVVEYEAIPRKESDGLVFPAKSPSTRTDNGTFNDPQLLDQWHYKNYGGKAYSTLNNGSVAGADVNVTDVWATLSAGDPDIIVAVVDEGVKYDHPDLKDNMWVNTKEIPGNGIDDDGNGYIDDVYGFNFVTNGPISWNESGDSGHGTHCAGTIAAVNNNGKGVCGIAGGSGKGDGCRIMSCQIFSGKSNGGARSVSRAIKYAADMGASIISCSYGYSVSFSSDDNYIRQVGSAEIDAIHYFEAASNNPVLDGNIAIFAAGNESHNFAHYPGAFYDIISVSAFAPDFLPAYYTNYGPGCNISAPGGEYYHGVGEKSMVLSTLPKELYGDDYGYMQGTSMACPHVSGVVALGLSYAKKLGKKFSRDEFKRMILASVKDIDERIGKITEKPLKGHAATKMAPFYHQMGTGAIDSWRLMMHIEGLPTLTSTIGEQQWIDLSSIFGTASKSLTYLRLEVPTTVVTSMGLQKISATGVDKNPAVADENGYAYVQFGRLYIHPTQIGSGKITITAVGGGDHVGGGSNPPGGMELTQSISLIARDTDGGNGTGGWL